MSPLRSDPSVAEGRRSVVKNSEEEDQEGAVPTPGGFMLLGTQDALSAANYVMIGDVGD